MTERSSWQVALACSLMPLAWACQPEIGDHCFLSTDCGYGSRVCDITQPSGYCTLYNCEPGGCPSEAICIGFHTTPSVAPGCRDPQASARLARSFCLRRCTSGSDCRGGYVCADMNPADNPWSGTVLEEGKLDGRVCIVPYSGPAVPSSGETGVCSGADGGFDALPPPVSVPEASTPVDAVSEGSG
jgi:hypothetical protein